MIRQILVCGSPNFLSNIAGRITSVVMNIVLLRFGGAAAVSIYGILMYVGDGVQAFLYGVCDSLQPAVGYNWGAGRKDRVKAIERCCFTASALLSVGFAAAVFLFPEPIVLLFAKEPDAAFLSSAVYAMRLMGVAILSRWISFATQSYMTAVDRPIYASILSVSTAFVFPLAFVVLLWRLGLTGIWLNAPATYLLAAGTAVWILMRFRKEWRKTEGAESK